MDFCMMNATGTEKTAEQFRSVLGNGEDLGSAIWATGNDRGQIERHCDSVSS